MTCSVQSGSLLGLEATPPISIANYVLFRPVERLVVCIVLLPDDMTPLRAEQRAGQLYTRLILILVSAVG